MRQWLLLFCLAFLSASAGCLTSSDEAQKQSAARSNEQNGSAENPRAVESAVEEPALKNAPDATLAVAQQVAAAAKGKPFAEGGANSNTATGEAEIAPQAQVEAAQKPACGQDTESDKARIAKELQESEQRDAEFVAGQQRAEAARKAQAKIDALRAHMDDCAAKLARLEPICDAVATGEPKVCETLVGRADVDGCTALATLSQAKLRQSTSLCRTIANRSMRSLCEGAVSGVYHCPENDFSPFAEACRRLASTPDIPECVPSSGSEDSQTCDAVWMTAAVQRRNSALCEKIALLRTRAACHAFVLSDRTSCPRLTDIPDACREVVVDVSLDEPQAAGGSATVRAKVVNLFSEPATCTITISVEQPNNVARTVKVHTGTLTASQQLADFTAIVDAASNSRAAHVKTECRWEGRAKKTR